MKTSLKALGMLLCLSLIITSAIFVQRTEARDKDSEHITFREPVTVAGTTLQPDTYKVVWNEANGSDVQVTFMKGSKTMATTTAKLVVESSLYDGAVETKTSPDNAKVLGRISWKKKALVFQPGS